MEIGFIGLGSMGSGMARNLLQSGHSVAVYNRTPEKAATLVGEEAIPAPTPADACRGRALVITMLANDQAVEDVVFGDSGIVNALAPGATHASCSTISTALARRLAAAHATRGQRYVSAPVLGRPEAAATRQLVVVAAGEPDTIASCNQIFQALGRQTLIAGSAPSQANAVKLCVNFMIAVLIESFGEAFATVRKSGVDPKLFLEIVNGLFRSPVYETYGRIIAEERFEPAGFKLELGLKDARLVLQTADENASPMPLASVVRDQFLSALANGQGALDWSSVAAVAARNAGLPRKPSDH
jgi:3-hydroxyisobutyrate dehydrogenase-like beta-hydroxyacid dehydrogenase